MILMGQKGDVVAKTIKTYEEIGEDYYKTHFNINDIKVMFFKVCHQEILNLIQVARKGGNYEGKK